MSEGKKRYLWTLCAACRKRLQGLGYLITDSERAPVWRPCALCGTVELVTPADLYKPPKRYRKRTGAGERGKAGRRRG